MKFVTEFDEIANFLEKYISQLDYEWALLYLMTNLQPSSYALRKNGLTRCMAHLEETREKRFKNRPLYDLLSSLDRELSSSNAAKRNWIDMYLRKAQLNGLHLKGGHRTKAASLIESIRQRENKFRDNVNTSAGAFRRNVLDPEMAKQLPHNLRAATKDGRSIEVTLEPTLFQFFLAHSANERERWNVWHANNVVASMRTDLKRSNNVLIDEIRFDKRQLAQLLDFDNHVEVALQDKMATSIQTVTRFVQQLHQSTRETFNNDLQSLLRFASDCKEFTSNYMNLWDIPYFVNLTKQYEFRVEQVSSYFPLPTVLSGIFRLLANRFGIQVICDESGNRSAWSPHVQLYRLVHGDQVLGSFFLDPYANVKQVQFHQITGRCASTESKPISALLLNFQAPISGQKTLLDFEDVILLFRTVSSSRQV